MEIYLDYNAGAPLRPEVRQALSEFLSQDGGNPSSVHRSGQRARQALERARAQVGALIDAPVKNIVFTSGGTEANNLAIFGALRAQTGRCKVVSSRIEHSSIINPLKAAEREGFKVIWLTPDALGRINIDEAIAELDEQTALVTLSLANSETGVIQNLAPLARAAREVGALIHVDAAQAIGRMRVSVKELDCDMMTLSGHKIGALAGIGALYVRDERRLRPLMFGGGQERGMRPGTQNLPGAISMGVAAEVVAKNLATEITYVTFLTERLRSHLWNSIPGIKLNGPFFGRIPNTLNCVFPGVRGDTMLLALDLEGVRVSVGSACAAGSIEPSHVLIAMGRSESEALSSLRLSLGPQLTVEQIDHAARIITHVWQRLSRAETSCRGVLP